ncbi:MAG: twin-arginine translocation signal domain-containing protein [Candidatus Promineifilaceae bacterium]
MSYDDVNQGMNRRGFLKAAALTAVAATATGTGAALLIDKGKPPTITSVQAPPLPTTPVTTVQTSQNASDLLARLAAAQAENVRLQSELGAAQRQLASYQPTTDPGSDPAAEAYQLQLEEANAQISSLNGQVGILGGLVALYEQVEGVDLGAVASNGIASVSGVLDELLQNVPSVEEGLQAGEQALSEFEAQVPLVDNGRRWLAEHIERVNAYYAAIEAALQEAVEAVGSFLQMLNQWFQDVLKWLPFGIGDKAASIMDAMTNLLAETPNTISGVRTNVVQPLNGWFELDEGETHLHRNLIKPVREGVLSRASAAMSQTHSVNDMYQTQLVQPIQANIEQKNAIREQIAAYRQEHQI